MEHRIAEPFTKDKLAKLKSGDTVFLTGRLYGARDAAHQKLVALVEAGEPLPLPLENAILYYTGPTPTKPGQPIGAAGPTTAYRMDAYAPTLLDLGQAAMIAKGQRNEAVSAAILRNGAVYFAAIGGGAAVLAKAILSAKVIAFPELQAEALWELQVQDFPVTVVMDSKGGDLYKEGRKDYLAQKK